MMHAKAVLRTAVVIACQMKSTHKTLYNHKLFVALMALASQKIHSDTSWKRSWHVFSTPACLHSHDTLP